MKIYAIIALLLAFIGPMWTLFSGQVDLTRNWRTANRASAQIAPSALIEKKATVQVYAAKAFGWRGMFAVHTWIATKEENAKVYLVYQIIGWQHILGHSALSIRQDIPDRYWFGNRPYLVKEIDGPQAKIIIDKIKAITQNYPYKNYYVLWPGPNSNTFISYIARHVPELQLSLPSNAIGKDFVPINNIFTEAPSNTGYQFSLYGLLGILIAKEEGLEINLLGLVYGIDPLHRAIKLPGIGTIKLF